MDTKDIVHMMRCRWRKEGDKTYNYTFRHTTNQQDNKKKFKESATNTNTVFLFFLPWIYFLLVAFPSAVTFRKIYKEINRCF